MVHQKLRGTYEGWRSTITPSLPYRSGQNSQEVSGQSLVASIFLSLGFGSFITMVLYLFRPDIVNYLTKSMGTVMPTNLVSFIFYIVTLALLVPFVEEFICRGVILNRLNLKYRTSTAIFLSSLVFAILHFDIRILGTFVFGSADPNHCSCNQ